MCDSSAQDLSTWASGVNNRASKSNSEKSIFWQQNIQSSMFYIYDWKKDPENRNVQFWEKQTYVC